jgi:hypothetical protein
MFSRTLFRSVSFSLLLLLSIAAHPAAADSSHARIVRLSLVQGDVRFARDFHGDPLADQKAAWEGAVLNLPIRQGYVLATDNGRAEVEFENGAMAFLGENTVLEFYDLSLEDGAKTTRLVLRQGTGSFYVNPSSSDYFSVTGGDFTVEAVDRTSFRLDNFDDGSAVNVTKGHVSVVRKDQTTKLAKGQSLSMHAGDNASVSIGRAADSDDFDRWVSGREESVVTATTAAQQYVNSSYYSSGFGDLYTYGSWYPVGGYGNCWRPYGVGYGWSPFDTGGWYSDPFFGWTFIGSQPWGWLPYHYGGWIFEPGFGWLWSPFGFGGFGGFVPFRPVTGVFVRSKTGLLGLVPVHPLDVHGKTPVNLTKGVFPVASGVVSPRLAVSTSDSWKVMKAPPRNSLSGNALVASSAPAPVSRTILAGHAGSRVVTMDRNSSIAYDAREHRFVNTNAAPASSTRSAEEKPGAQQSTGTATAGARVAGQPVTGSTQAGVGVVRGGMPPSSTRAANSPSPGRSMAPPSARAMTPPPSPRSGGYSSGGGFNSSGRGESAGRATASAPASHASSGPASSGGHPH